MSASVDFPVALPTITPAPRRKRRRKTADFTLEPRQQIFDDSAVDAAIAQCQNVGNDVVSCFPSSNLDIPQHELAYFVWNSQRPQIAQTNIVNIYLLPAGSDTPLLSWLNIRNPTGRAGNLATAVNDSWFPDGGLGWSGSNVSTPLYFVITRSDEGLDGSQTPQATFNAIQTTIADSVSSSLASVSAVSTASVASRSAASASQSAVFASSSAAAASSASLASIASASRSAASAGATNGTGSLQPADDSSFPHWAIAVIVVLGFLAILAIGALVFLIMRRLRRRDALASSQRNSMGSASPMIPGGAGAAGGTTRSAEGAGGAPQSPAMEETRRLYDPPVSVLGHASLNSPNDDASLISHAQSAAHSTGDPGLFSTADAAIMADAFRKVLRKPDFPGRPPLEEGESPESDGADPVGGENRLMNWELAEEGRDIRSVGSSRGVRVETLSDDGGAR